MLPPPAFRCLRSPSVLEQEEEEKKKKNSDALERYASFEYSGIVTSLTREQETSP